MKGQVVVNAQKEIVCVHFTRGRDHDFSLFKRSKLNLSSRIAVNVDSGYQGIQEYVNRCELPTKRSKHHPLTKEDKRRNREQSKRRIIVEHVNAKIKTFKMMAGPYRNRRRRFGLRFTLICGLINHDQSLAA